MKITASRAAMVSALKTAAGVADQKTPNPILRSVVLRPGHGVLHVTAMDLNVTVTVNVEATIAGDRAPFLVPAKRILELVANAPGTDVTLEHDGGSSVEVRAGRWKGQVPTNGNPRDFPAMAEPNDVMWPVSPESMRTVLKSCLPSICEDETRFHLNGIALVATGGVLRGISTDGHRMAKIERSCDHEWRPVILPAKACKVVMAALDGAEELMVSVEKQRMFARIGWMTIAAKLVDAQFPPWEHIVAQSKRTSTVTFDRSAFAESLDRAKVALGNVEAPKVHLEINGVAKITARTTEGFSSDDIVDVEREGKEVDVAADPNYLSEALRVLGGERVSLTCGDELDPLLFHPDGVPPAVSGGDFVLVLPMRK